MRLDVFDNPFATRDSRGVRRIHRNDGKYAKRPWSKRKGIRTRKASARKNPYKTTGKSGTRVRRNDGRFAGGSWAKMKKLVKARHPAPIMWEKKMLAAKARKAKARKVRKNPAVYANPYKTTGKSGTRVRRNDGRFASGSWSKMARKVRARHPAPIMWEKRMIAGRRRAAAARHNPSRHNPFLDAQGRVRINRGRFAKSPYSTPRPWMTTQHAAPPWLVRKNPTPGVSPSGFQDRDLDIVFSNPTGRKKPKAKSKARSKARGKKKTYRTYKVGGRKVSVKLAKRSPGVKTKRRKSLERAISRYASKGKAQLTAVDRARLSGLTAHHEQSELAGMLGLHHTPPYESAYRREAPKRTGSGLAEFHRQRKGLERQPALQMRHPGELHSSLPTSTVFTRSMGDTLARRNPRKRKTRKTRRSRR